MRKKLQDKMFEISYLIELLISVLVGVAVVILAVWIAIDMFKMSVGKDGVDLLEVVFDKAITLAIGAELIKMLCKHTPETVDNLITVVAIAVLFAVRRFLLNRHDMVETPDGLVEIDDAKE